MEVSMDAWKEGMKETKIYHRSKRTPRNMWKDSHIVKNKEASPPKTYLEFKNRNPIKGLEWRRSWSEGQLWLPVAHPIC